LLQQREELSSYANAQKAGVAVRRIERVRNGVSCKVCVDIPASGANERADEVPRTSRQHGEPARTRAPEEPHHHCFCAVVGVMCCRKDVGPGSACGLAEGLVTCLSSSRLKVAPGDHANPCTAHRHIESAGEVGRKIEFARRLRAQAVIDPVCHETVAELVAQACEHVE
jgi:hypothetical protein